LHRATLILFAGLVIASQPVFAATELTYTGTVIQVQRGREVPTKSFRLVSVVANRTSFVVEEDGAGGWPWPARFGQVSDKQVIRLLHEHDGSRYPIPLPDPVFASPDRLKAGESWQASGKSYQVEGTKKINGRSCRQVRVTADRGLVRTIWVDESNHQVVSAEQRFFMGRGDQFKLKMQLDSQKQLSDDESLLTDNTLTALLKLQSSMERSPDEQRPELTAKQTAIVNAQLAALEKLSAETSFADLVVAMRRDVKSQLKRQMEVAGLGKNLVGKAAPSFSLTALTGKEIPATNYKGKPVVLHFWTYNGEKLEEPYGQVGYLDFLSNRRKESGVKVYGVAVDSRIVKNDERRAAIRSIRKMRDFMNLSYDLAIDDGTLLDRFGDPRAVGAKLPLWVVIAPDGKVAHYHAGFHTVEQRSGLKALDEVVSKLK